jgi:hypothetical protein
MLGCLHHCLQTHTTYDESAAFIPSPGLPEPVAA